MPDRQAHRRARAQTGGADKDTRHVSPRSGDADPQSRPSYSSTRSSPGRIALSTSASPAKRQHQQSPPIRRSFTNDQHGQPNGTTSRGWPNGLHTDLPPIPASPYASEPSTPASRKSTSPSSAKNGKSGPKEQKQRHNSGSNAGAMTDTEDGLLSRSRSKSSSYVPYRSPAPQSLNAAVEMFSLSERRSTSDHGHPLALRPGAAEGKPRPSTSSSSSRSKEKRDVIQSPTKNLYTTHGAFWMTRSTSTPPTVNGKTISNPIPNEGATDSLTTMALLIGLDRGFVGNESTQESIDRQTYPCLGLGKPSTFPSCSHSNTCIRVCSMLHRGKARLMIVF